VREQSRPIIRRLAVGALAILLAVVGTFLVVTAVSRPAAPQVAAESPSPQPSESPDREAPSVDPLEAAAAAPAPLTDDEDVEVERVAAVTRTVVDVVNEIGIRGDGSAMGAAAVATGFVLGEIEASARERYDLGYRQVGEAKVVETTASDIDLDADPARMTVTVCVDVSDVDVLDEAGNSLKASLYDPGRPVRHIYGAIHVDGAWKLTSHEIPAQQDCPNPGDER